MGQRDIGKIITKALYPEIELEPDGSDADKNGIDGIYVGKTIQIKYNHRIIDSGNLYHEIYEKSVNRPEQDWRPSLSKAYYHLFITKNDKLYKSYLITTDQLARLEIGERLYPISPNNSAETSMGFLLPLKDINFTFKCIPIDQVTLDN